MKLFETEDDAIKWVGMNIALAIKPKNKSNTFSLVSPFSSLYAHQEVVENLGKELFKFQQEKIKP